MTLPYPGYSWSFTQHMGRVNSRELFSLLNFAYIYRDSPNYRSLINQYLATGNIFTPNVRADSSKVDAWRDYQQILPELGLMYSTKYKKQPYFTQMGLMYIDGTIGYSEVFSNQVLAYQYPNGHKTDISPPVRRELSKTSIQIPQTRSQLDINCGVLIKPGVLILQILIELFRQQYSPTLNTRECLMALVPTKRNTDWQNAFNALIQFKQGVIPHEEDERRLRHVQEWFQFLGLSDFAVKTDDSISLSALALEKIDELQVVLNFHTEPINFWYLFSFN